MNQFSLGNFISKFVNYSLSNFKDGNTPNAPANSDLKFQMTQDALNKNIMQKSLSQAEVFSSFTPATFANLKMNNLASLERSLYLKDLMKLPKDLEDVLVLIQNDMNTAKDVTKLLATNINLTALAELIKQNGKEAMSKLILVMANASKQGITDLSQIKDAIKFINASVSVASQENPSQILKNFMLLYLPWLPLKEGVDFDLEIESSEGEDADSQTSITIMISTINYGNVKITLILLGGNSIDVFVNCSEDFPKTELLKRINLECKNHSMQSSVVFEQKAMKQDENTPRQAKISMSNLTEVNPFLLLMANLVIKHTIDLDNAIET